MKTWAVRIKVLIISALIASIGNMLASLRAGEVIWPWEVLPALSLMFVIVLAGCALDGVLRKYLKLNLPKILYVSLITVFVSIPGLSPLAGFMQVEFAKIGLLPLCTPILAYAGIAIGTDLESFKKQGLGIMCVAILTFLGTYMGSAVIAQVVLKLTGAI